MLEHLARYFRQKRLPPAQLQMLRPRRRLSALRRLRGTADETFPVYLIERAQAVRVALADDLRAAGFEVRPFATLDDFVDALRELEPGCVILDIAELDTLALNPAEEAAYRSLGCPLVLVFDSLDGEEAASAVRLGAIDLVRRPVSAGELIAALRRAGASVGEQRARLASLGARKAIERLSKREREVMDGIMRGYSSKEIARILDLSPRTVEMHRSRLHQKLEASSMAQLLGIAWRARGIEGP